MTVNIIHCKHLIKGIKLMEHARQPANCKIIKGVQQNIVMSWLCFFGFSSFCLLLSLSFLTFIGYFSPISSMGHVLLDIKPFLLMLLLFLCFANACFPPFQNSSAALVYLRFLRSLCNKLTTLCSVRMTSAGLSQLLDLRRTVLRATSLFFSTPIIKKYY